MLSCSQLKASLGGAVHLEILEFDAEWQKLRSRKLSIDDSLFNPHDFSFTSSAYIFFQVKSTYVGIVVRFVEADWRQIWYDCSYVFCRARPARCLACWHHQ